MKTTLKWAGLLLLMIGGATTAGFAKRARIENRSMTAVEYVGVPPFLAGVVLTFWYLRTHERRVKNNESMG